MKRKIVDNIDFNKYLFSVIFWKVECLCYGGYKGGNLWFVFKEFSIIGW